MNIETILKYVPFSIIWVHRKAIGEPNTLLDLGSGDGTFTKSIKLDSDWIITAADIYPKIVKDALRNDLYKKVINGDVNTIVNDLIKKKQKYNVVLLSQVIEHLNKNEGKKLLKAVEKIATNRIVVGTPRGYLSQEDVFVDENPFQKHKSGWTTEEFQEMGYVVRGVGLNIVWKEKGPGRSGNMLKVLIFRLFSLLCSPMVYYHPEYASGLVCYKEMHD